MTANIDVLTDKRENVIAIPNRAVLSTNGDKLVKMVGDDGKLQEVKVRLGMRDSEGNVEITDGIKEGDKVVTFEKTK